MTLKTFGEVLYLEMAVSIYCVIAVEIVVSTLYMLINILFLIT